MTRVLIDDLPGAALIRRGVSDVRSAKTSIESLLVTIAAPRLQALGVLEHGEASHVHDAELALYELLGESGSLDPYSRYNALKRELASFVHALEQRVERSSKPT
jgi:hypothetical protein